MRALTKLLDTPSGAILANCYSFIRACRPKVRSLWLSIFFAILVCTFEAISMFILLPLTNIFLHPTNPAHSLNALPRQLLQWMPEGGVYLLPLLTVVFIGAIVLKSLSQFLSGYYSTVFGEHFGHALRVSIFNCFINKQKQYFDQSAIGHLHQISINYVNSIISAFQFLLSLGLAVLTSVAYISILLFIAPWFTVVIGLTLPLLYLMNGLVIKITSNESAQALDPENKLGRLINNALSSITTIKIAGTQQKELQKFRQLSRNLEQAKCRLGRIKLSGQPVQEIASTLFFFSAVALYSLFVVGSLEGQIAASDYLVYFVISRRLMSSFTNANVSIGALAVVAGQMKEINQLLRSGDTEPLNPDGMSLQELNHGIRLVNLNFGYEHKSMILKGINCTFRKNQLTAIVGPTGSGKSTLASLLLGLYRVPNDSIYFDNQSVEKLSLCSIRRQIAFVEQDPQLNNDTFLNNLIYGLDRPISPEEIRDILVRTSLDSLVQNLPKGLSTEIGDRGVLLSGGERQRIVIARALLKKASILIMDEATSALDSTTEQLIQKALSELMGHTTRIVIAHRFSTIRHADCILVLQGGAIVEEGSFDKLVAKKGTFYRLWKAQKLKIAA